MSYFIDEACNVMYSMFENGCIGEGSVLVKVRIVLRQ